MFEGTIHFIINVTFKFERLRKFSNAAL